MSPIDSGNLLAGLAKADEEQIQMLIATKAVRIERIVSSGQASPPGFWYDQESDEFVLLVAGEAGLRFEHESAARHVRAGNWVHIPARCRHRVDWTHTTQPTIWLAVHFDGAKA